MWYPYLGRIFYGERGYQMGILDSASAFFQTNGRDIDQARFAYHFQGGSQEDLLTALAHYQNPDGGFFGLEVDIKAPVSNPFATELALTICQQAGVLRHHPALQATVRYLESTQAADGTWRFAPEVYEHALAPWFQGWEWPNLNPACSLVGLLKMMGLGSDALHAGVEHAFTQFARPQDVAEGEFYAVRPYTTYFLPEWQHPQREFYLAGVLWWIVRQELKQTFDDSDHFFAYVRDPQTDTARLLPPTMIAARLDQLAADQAEDGGWPSPYDAGWRGWTTMQALLVLRAFGRV